MRAGCSCNQRADRLHRHLGLRDLAELGQNPAGTGEAMPALGRIGDAAQRAIGHVSRAAPWTWMKKTSTLSLEPGDLQTLAGKRALFDRRAVEILDDARLACGGRRPDTGRSRRPVRVVDIDQIGGTRQQRYREALRADRRGLGLRLVEPGDEALSAGFGLLRGPA